MFTLLVRFDLPDPAAAAAFDRLVAGTVPQILEQEPGTLRYDTYDVEGAPLARVFHEVYRDRDAHAAHEARPGTAAYLEHIVGLGARVRVEVLAGPAGRSGRPGG